MNLQGHRTVAFSLQGAFVCTLVPQCSQGAGFSGSSSHTDKIQERRCQPNECMHTVIKLINAVLVTYIWMYQGIYVGLYATYSEAHRPPS